MPPKGSTKAGILPGCPSLDRGSREIEVGFEPQTFASLSSTWTVNCFSELEGTRRGPSYGGKGGLTRSSCHGCTRAGILPGRPHLDRRTIRVLNQSLWLKSLTARQRCWAGNASALPFLRNTSPHMFQPPTWRARRLCSSDLYPWTNLV
ncbi:hypothetical protein CSKR_114390 [Clonorchis sinensis]|uniref:Uncharacterized protein n=1 Tax=Clonorchis sinensis TaxID=79923 RepID=A0A3R7H2K8_CLOSI|nr:hypothetical protein CSKR_114390 [Clonorchis sinensis]